MQKNRIFIALRFVGVLYLLVLSSCQTLPPQQISPHPAFRRSGVQHTVAPGETLWRISQMYNVPLASIMQANYLKNEGEVKMGQKLLIPDAKKPHQVISLFPSNKWQYIIIHHSATEKGSSLSFHNSHTAKGWDRGVGYHFIINNGQADKPDGFVEITPRWLKQEDGAHCKASNMNAQGIGICLVGNFNKEKVTRAQMKALVDLVDKLRDYYNIPAKNILGHKHVRDSHTDCPGTHFPWKEFERKL